MTEGLLAGEQVLWSGRPAAAGAGLADIGRSLYELAALAVLALGGGLFSPSRASAAAVLRSVADAAQAQQIAAAARRRLRDGLTRPVPTPAGSVTGALPAGVVLQRGERVLWAGGPVRVPWWFGSYDIYLSAFGLAWLAFMCLMGALAVTGGAGAFLIFVVPGAVAGGVYPAAGRLIHRRMRIRRSAYVITSRRLITCWQFGSRPPVIVTAPLRQLLPPAIRWRAVFTDPAAPGERGRAAGWKNMLWPASTTTPPVLIGPADPAAILDLVATAQIALRATPPPAAYPPSPATARPQ